VTSIEDFTFLGCARLTNVMIPTSVTYLGLGAFQDCTSLTSVTIPPSVTSLGVSVFSSCSNLTSVTVGPGVATIGDTAFQYCTNLTGVYFQGDAPSLVGKLVFDGDNNTIVYYLANKQGWSTTFGGRPTKLWVPPDQITLTEVGVRTNQFGFTITGPNGWTVVVEATPSLAIPTWLPLETNTLSNGSAYFSDPQWANSTARSYRVRSP